MYIPPSVPAEELERIYKHLVRAMAMKSPTDLRKLCLALASENARLCAEVNDHRAARGIEPMKIYTPGE